MLGLDGARTKLEGASIINLWLPNEPLLVANWRGSLWILNPQGEGVAQITASGGSLLSTAFSRDGDKLAYTQTGNDKQTELFVYDFEEQTNTFITKFRGHIDYMQWSADDSRIVYTFGLHSPILAVRSLPESTPETILEHGLLIEAIPLHTNPNAAIQQAGGLSVEFVDFRMNPALAEVEVCVEFPHKADWIPKANLTLDGNEYQADGWALLDWRNQDLWSKHGCYRIEFTPNGQDAYPTTARLEIQRFQTSIPEEITHEDCNRARLELAAREPSINVECSDIGHTQRYEITQKPEELTIEQAYELLYEAFAEKVIRGPWVFPIELSQN